MPDMIMPRRRIGIAKFRATDDAFDDGLEFTTRSFLPMQPRILTRSVYLSELAIGTVLFLIFAPGLFGNFGDLRGWAVVVWCFAIWWMRVEPGRPSWAFHLLADAAVLGIGVWLLYLDLAPLGEAAGRKAAMAAPMAFAAGTIGELLLVVPSFVALVFLSGDGESFAGKNGAEG